MTDAKKLQNLEDVLAGSGNIPGLLDVWINVLGQERELAASQPIGYYDPVVIEQQQEAFAGWRARLAEDPAAQEAVVGEIRAFLS